MGSIIKNHNKKIIATKKSENLSCNCREKQSCPLNGRCREKNVIYKCVASVPNKEDKVYIGLTEGEWKKISSYCDIRVIVEILLSLTTVLFIE